MAWTRAEYLSEARRAAEKEDDLDRYPEDSLKRLFSVVHRSEWRRLLDLAPRHRMVTTGVVLGGSLTVAPSLLTGPYTDGAIHRIHRVLVGGQSLVERPDNGPALTESSIIPAPGWRWENETLVCDGLPVATQLVISASVIPAMVTATTSDEEPIDWDDEYAFVLVYEIAGQLLAKGSVESGEAADQFRMADAERQKMMAVLRRKGVSVESLRPTDDAADWGWC